MVTPSTSPKKASNTGSDDTETQRKNREAISLAQQAVAAATAAHQEIMSNRSTTQLSPQPSPSIPEASSQVPQPVAADPHSTETGQLPGEPTVPMLERGAQPRSRDGETAGSFPAPTGQPNVTTSTPITTAPISTPVSTGSAGAGPSSAVPAVSAPPLGPQRSIQAPRNIPNTPFCAGPSSAVPQRSMQAPRNIPNTPLCAGPTSAVPAVSATPLGPQRSMQAPRNIPNTPFISYAHQAGLASHQVSSQRTSQPVVPTFYSEWAHVAPEETRPVREDVLQATHPRDHMSLQSSMLSGAHEWTPVPVSNMSYKYYVENEREDVRPDLLRFKIMMIQYKETAHEAWSKFVESRHWWIVPSTLRCDRTFCRDAFECYYVDAMDRAFASEHEPSAVECPLFRFDVLDRWWNAFSRKPDFLFELFTRMTARVLVPYDSYETCHYTSDELRQHFPGVPAWMLELGIPAGIPLPLAPVAYYFHSDLLEGADVTRNRRAHYFLKLEYMGLGIAFWYNEMIHGGRQWVMPPSSVQVLREHCLPLDIVKGVPTADILNMMMGSRVRDPTYWNTYKAGAAAIPDCHFVDCEPGSGDYLPWMTGSRVELADMKSRKVKLVLRQHRRVQVRRSSPLSLRLLVADLVCVPGLDNFVRGQRWLQVDNIRVHDLLSKLFSRTRRQEDHIRKLEQELRSTKFDLNGIRAAYKESERELDKARQDLRDLERSQTSQRNRGPESYGRVPNGQRSGNSLPSRREHRPMTPTIPGARSPFVAPVRPEVGNEDLRRIPRMPPSYRNDYGRHAPNGGNGGNGGYYNQPGSYY